MVCYVPVGDNVPVCIQKDICKCVHVYKGVHPPGGGHGAIQIRTLTHVFNIHL